MTTKDDIKRWFERGLQNDEAEFMIVVCDTYDWSDYPVYVSAANFAERYNKAKRGENMEKVMEVYDLSLDLNTQLDERRAFHYPEGFVN